MFKGPAMEGLRDALRQIRRWAPVSVLLGIAAGSIPTSELIAIVPTCVAAFYVLSIRTNREPVLARAPAPFTWWQPDTGTPTSRRRKERDVPNTDWPPLWTMPTEEIPTPAAMRARLWSRFWEEWPLTVVGKPVFSFAVFSASVLAAQSYSSPCRSWSRSRCFSPSQRSSSSGASLTAALSREWEMISGGHLPSGAG